MSNAPEQSPPPGGRRAGTQTDAVIDGVRAMIRAGGLKAGDRLPVEKDLAALLGVSRGSLREGVRALAALGILESRQGDGTYVTSLDPHLLLGSVSVLADLPSGEADAELSVVRRVLEVEAVALAATRASAEDLVAARHALAEVDAQLLVGTAIDPESAIEADAQFHRAIARASGNAALAALIDHLVSRTLRVRLWRAVHEHGAVLQAHTDHHAILSALEHRAPDQARARMAVHLFGVEDYLARGPGAADPGAAGAGAEPAADGSDGTAGPTPTP